MSIQNQDGSFGPTLPLGEAMAEFQSRVFENDVPRALFTAESWQEMETVKEREALKQRVDDLSQKVKELSPVKSDLIDIPTAMEVKKIITETL